MEDAQMIKQEVSDALFIWSSSINAYVDICESTKNIADDLSNQQESRIDSIMYSEGAKKYEAIANIKNYINEIETDLNDKNSVAKQLIVEIKTSAEKIGSKIILLEKKTQIQRLMRSNKALFKKNKTIKSDAKERIKEVINNIKTACDNAMLVK